MIKPTSKPTPSEAKGYTEPRRTCRDWTLSYPTARYSEGKGTVRYSGKPETEAITPSARALKTKHGVTESKESTNVLFAGQRWGKTKKGPKAFVAERVFVKEDIIQLGVGEPTGTFEFTGHVSDKAGQRAVLTAYEYVERPEVSFHVMVVNDCI